MICALLTPIHQESRISRWYSGPNIEQQPTKRAVIERQRVKVMTSDSSLALNRTMSERR